MCHLLRLDGRLMMNGEFACRPLIEFGSARDCFETVLTALASCAYMCNPQPFFANLNPFLFLGFHVPKKASKYLSLPKKNQKNSRSCGGLGGENPAAFPKVRPIFQQLFSLPESAQPWHG